MSLIRRERMRRWLISVSVVLAMAGAALLFRELRAAPSTETRNAHVPSTKSVQSAAKALHPTPPPKKAVQGNLDVTLLVASDTHVGYLAPPHDDSERDPRVDPRGLERDNLRMIAAMNEVEGRPWPSPLGGTIGRPAGVLVSGDLTENGGEHEWTLWTKLYGLSGEDGELRYPVYEGAGNHDRVKNWHVREQVKKRHGGRHYFVDFGDLRVVCLGEAPDEEALKVLQTALDSAERDVPFLLYFHMPLRGPYSNDNWWGRSDGREKLKRAIVDRRTVGIFHGHYHATGAYRWEGHDVYNVGSPKYVHQSFAIVHMTNASMTVAEWDYSHKRYSWWHKKPLHAEAGIQELGGVDAALEPPPTFSLATSGAD